MKFAGLIWQKPVCPAASFPLSIFCLKTQSTVPSLGPHNSYRQHFAAQTLTLTMDKAQTSIAVRFIFCATFVVPFCQTFSQIQVLTHTAQVPPPHLPFARWCHSYGGVTSQRSEVLGSHSIFPPPQARFLLWQLHPSIQTLMGYIEDLTGPSTEMCKEFKDIK